MRAVSEKSLINSGRPLIILQGYCCIVNDKVLFTLSFTAPDFGRFSGILPHKIRAHPPEVL